MAEWWRAWHGAPTDSKWLVIARRANVPAGMVSALWYALQDYASQAVPRGSIAGFDMESYAAWSGWDEDELRRVMVELKKPRKGPDGKPIAGVINNGELTAWARRQPKREDWSTDRVRKHRDAKSIDDNVPAKPVSIVPPDKETRSNALKRIETIEQRRTEEIEESRKQKQSSVSIETGASAEKVETMLQKGMQLARELNFETDARDGSVLKDWEKRGRNWGDVEARMRGLALMRDRGELKEGYGISPGDKLSMRLLHWQDGKLSGRPLGQLAEERWHAHVADNDRRNRIPFGKVGSITRGAV